MSTLPSRLSRFALSLVLGVAMAGTLMPVSIRGQKADLSPDEIRQAIERGKKKSLSDVGLQMSMDSGGKKVAKFLLAAPDTETYGGSVTLFTPITWIERMAAQAAGDFMTLTAENVTANDLAPVIRVFVDMPQVQQVVLRDNKKKMVVMPVEADSGIARSVAERHRIPFKGGVRLAVNPPQFAFDLDEVRALRAQSPDILVTIVAYSAAMAVGPFSSSGNYGQHRFELNVRIDKSRFDKDLP